MSENGDCQELSHDIQTWNSKMCQFLLPYWQKSHFLELSYMKRSIFTPPYLNIQTHIVEMIFHTCAMLDQPLPVYFLSVDIFDSFISNHTIELFECLAKTQSDTEGFLRCWAVVKTHVTSQLYLRLLSCIQLASKIIFTGQLVTTSQIKSLLTGAEQNFEVESIITSEFRVFKTLGFKIPLHSTLDVLEQLLEVHSAPVGLNPEEIHPTCVAVLKLMYLQHAALSSSIAPIESKPHFPSLLAGGSLLAACRLSSLNGGAISFLYSNVASYIKMPKQYLIQFVDTVFCIILN